MVGSNQTKKPNFLVIIADDLGFSDLGCFGGEISTPNLDKLGFNGTRLTGFHTASACSPTRSMLFSGTDNHLAGLGQMAETLQRTQQFFGGKPGYEGMLNQRVAALSEVLGDAGYETIMSGKWHLGLTKDSIPAARGFEKVFALLSGASNHYGYEPLLEDKTPAMKLTPPLYTEGHKSVPVESLENFYSSTYFTDKLLSYLDTRDTERPFFSYLAFTAPHWPLQAPREVIQKYAGRYDKGPDVLRAERLQRLKELCLIDENVEPAPLTSVFGYKPWNEQTQEERRLEARKMEVYAAMIEIMDSQIGRVVEQLKKSGELDNTFIFFASDNGAEGALLEAIPILGDAISENIRKYFDNSLENIGNGNSFTWIGPSWAQAATAPSRMYKTWSTEGGVRCPAIIHYPNLQVQRPIEPSLSTVMDVMPTLLELAGATHPAPSYKGRPVLPMRGKSWLPHLKGEKAEFHDEDAVFGWELFGQAAVRRGKWKALWVPPPSGPNRWQLFDIDNDPGELHDKYETEPAKLAEMIEHWRIYEAETGTILVNADKGGDSAANFGFYTGYEFEEGKW